MAQLDRLNKSVSSLFEECEELTFDRGKSAEELICSHLTLITERTPYLLIEEFNTTDEIQHNAVDKLILSLHKIIAEDLTTTEKLLVYVENTVSSFQQIVFPLLQEIAERLFSIKMFLPICSIGEKLRILDMLYRLFGIALYFRITHNALLMEFTKILLTHCSEIRKSYVLFVEILMYLIENFNSRKIPVLDAYLVQLNFIDVESQEELSFLLLLKGLLNYYRGKLHLIKDIYEQYTLLSPHSYTYLNEYFSLKISLGSMILGDYNASYGIIQSFKLSAKYKGKMHVATRWVHHLAFLLLHKRNFNEAKHCIDEAENLIKNVNADVPASFIRRSKAFFMYLRGDYEKAVQFVNEDSQKSYIDGKFIAPMIDPVVIEMMYDLEINKGYDLGNYNIRNLIQIYLAGVSCVTIGTAHYLQALLTNDIQEKKQCLEKAFAETFQTGCLRLIEKIGNSYLQYADEHEKDFIRQKIAYWQSKQTVHKNVEQNAPFYSTYACMKELMESQNNSQSYFNIQQFLLIVQRGLEAQRAAFFEVDRQKKVCLGTANISPVEMEKFSFAGLEKSVQEYKENFGNSPEYFLISKSIGIFCFPKNEQSIYVLYLENELCEGIFLSFSPIEQKAFSWFLFCYIRSHASRFLQNFVANSYSSTFKYQKALEPYWGDDMAQILEKVRSISYTDISILIRGETGVGKEQLAQYIHKHSRADMPFICVHLASIPLELFESELFGHEKGAFTGALQQKKGVFELAHNGTLFLDEIADVPMQMQIKLLRVLQEKKFNRVGGTEVIFSNFRLVAATNKDLWQEVEKGLFREDLYYRISMATVIIPSLRERKKDFPMLVQNIYAYYCTKYNKEIGKISKTDYQKLYQHTWSGNIRELCSVLEKFVILGEIEIFEKNRKPQIEPKTFPEIAEDFFAVQNHFPSLEELEQKYIRFVLEKTHGKIYGKDGALEILKMKKSTFYNRLEQYGIKIK